MGKQDRKVWAKCKGKPYLTKGIWGWGMEMRAEELEEKPSPQQGSSQGSLASRACKVINLQDWFLNK